MVGEALARFSHRFGVEVGHEDDDVPCGVKTFRAAVMSLATAQTRADGLPARGVGGNCPFASARPCVERARDGTLLPGRRRMEVGQHVVENPDDGEKENRASSYAHQSDMGLCR